MMKTHEAEAREDWGVSEEYKSRIEDYADTIELHIPASPVFGKYKPFLYHAQPHPTKNNVNLVEYLVKKLTNPGETILDPFAGTGSTGVIAALHSRNAILVEIEPVFCQWIAEAAKRVEVMSTISHKGWIKIVCGDSTKLTKLLSDHGVNDIVDAMITSPPYTNRAADHRVSKYRKGGLFPEEKLDYKPSNGNLETIPWDKYIVSLQKVYSEVYKVLRPGGIVAVIVKPFYRDGKVVDLPYYTWLTLKATGYTLEKVYKNRLATKTFWRIVYEKKNPDKPHINHEYIVVCSKQS